MYVRKLLDSRSLLVPPQRTAVVGALELKLCQDRDEYGFIPQLPAHESLVISVKSLREIHVVSKLICVGMLPVPPESCDDSTSWMDATLRPEGKTV